MRERLVARLRSLAGRLRRIRRRELIDIRRWVESTDHVVHLSMLVFAPLLIWLVTTLANAAPSLTFLLFPPLASGTYTLFVDPHGRYSDPVRFVAGLTIGALCGLGALWVSNAVLPATTSILQVNPTAAAVAVLATGLVTWPLDIEEPSGYSTALLTLLVQPSQRLPYLGSIFLASSIVAVVFVAWRSRFYEQRATYLYQSTQGDDHVLVPMRGDHPGPTAILGARLAAAHEAGKVVLLDFVSDAEAAREERRLLDDDAGEAMGDGGRPLDPTGGETPGTLTGADNLSAQVEWLETHAERIETMVGVPCQVAVVATDGSPAKTTLRTVDEVNCDLIVAPYESEHGALSPYLRKLLGGPVDVVVHRSRSEQTRWDDILVPVRSASVVAHHMLDFATRLAGGRGTVSVGTCISDSASRREAEERLADLVEPFEGAVETRVSRADIDDFLASTAPKYDIVFIGASQDRSTASRFISPPTFERLEDVETDVAIVDRGR